MVVSASGLTAGGAHADPPVRSPIAAKVAPAVRAELTRTSKATFWVELGSRPDISGATRLRDDAEKAAYVYRTETAHAARTQAGLRTLLASRKAEFTPFWIANTIKVTGDARLLREIADRPEVAHVRADRAIPLPTPAPGVARTAADGTEWNVATINAPRVWNELAVRGEGVVVANIDTGVQFDHPTLAAKYRGRRASGEVDHNYNWFDPSQICTSQAPCDNNGHGTHTMGTMVGGDDTDQIGVAPGASWIAAKGCESSGCSRSALLAAGQWIIAPTDLAGRNPRPDLAPDVVNNSWGANRMDPWYQQVVASWVAAGIFPAFANGNAGPACNTSGSPGSYSAAYSSGAFDMAGTIAPFSSRGSGENADIKPNIAAPGVDVRSSVAGNRYATLSGTSMASPHTAATVALMWSAAPELDGDIDRTRRILDATAIDVRDASCGGNAALNNVWGEGRLDAFAAVSASPRDHVGGLTGNITADGWPVGDATVSVTGPVDRTVTTAKDGQYRFHRLITGDYTLTVTKFGYVTVTDTVTIEKSQVATAVLALRRVPSAVLSGTVRGRTGPLPGAVVTVVDTPLHTRTDAAGRYQVTVPLGEYEVRAEHADPCLATATERVSLARSTILDLALPDRRDRFGHTCGAPIVGDLAGTDRVDLWGDDNATQISLPFPVRFYGGTYFTAWVSTNGLVSFGDASTRFANGPLPDQMEPNTALYPFWDDLYVDDEAGVYTGVSGDPGHQVFVIEWRNVNLFADASQRLSFAVAIGADGTITYRYKNLVGGPAAGASATVGLENADGTDGFQYSYDTALLTDGAGVTFRVAATQTGSLRPRR